MSLRDCQMCGMPDFSVTGADGLCDGCRKEDNDCCPGCGACPGFTGVDCDETCEWATTGGGAPTWPNSTPGPDTMPEDEA